MPDQRFERLKRRIKLQAWEETKPIKEWPMYRQYTQKEVDQIIAKARSERAGAFGRLIAGLFGR